MTAGERLAAIRKERGYSDPVDAARAMGINRYTYAQHENGTRGLRRDVAIRYARFFHVSLDWLLNERGPKDSWWPTVRVVHYVGAGAEVHPIDEFAPGEIGEDKVEAPPGGEDSVAALITGDSMYPLREGWLIFYRAAVDAGVSPELAGKLCIVQVDNGPMLIKNLRRGNHSGVWTLESWNAPAREDVKLAWAARVIDIRPR